MYSFLNKQKKQQINMYVNIDLLLFKCHGLMYQKSISHFVVHKISQTKDTMYQDIHKPIISFPN